MKKFIVLFVALIALTIWPAEAQMSWVHAAILEDNPAQCADNLENLEFFLVDPRDGRILVVDRTSGAEPDIARTLLFVAEARNPGLIDSFSAMAVDEWTRLDRVDREAVGGPNGFLQTKAATQLVPYLRAIRAAVPADHLDTMAFRPSVIPLDLKGLELPPFSARWYHPSNSLEGVTLNELMFCTPDCGTDLPSTACKPLCFGGCDPCTSGCNCSSSKRKYSFEQ